MISCIEPANKASIAVAECLGATYEKTVKFHGQWDAAIYRHPSRNEILGAGA